METPPTVVHLRAAGVSLLLDTTPGRLPRVLHWGADLGELDEGALTAVAATRAEPLVGSEFDERHLVSVSPEPAWGWMGTPGLAGSRAGRDHSPFFVSDPAVIERYGEGDSRVERVTVVATDALAELALTVEIEMRGSGLVRARSTLASHGDGSSATTGDGAAFTMEALNVFMPVPRRAEELLDYTGRWIRERTPQRTEFTVGTRLREARRGKPGHDSAFLMAAGTPGFGFRRGEVWLAHVGWSGNSRLLAERSMNGVSVIGGGELPMPGEIRLLPGEQYTSPWVYFSYGGAGLDEASSRIHRFLRARPQHPTSPRPVLVNTWEAVYFDHDAARLRALADAAAAVGAERLVLDDGWFRHRRSDNAGLGDWYVDEGVYPEGLRPFADYVRSKGLEFGLWVEPEMINPDSDVACAHPEWIAQPELAARREAVSGQTRLPLHARRQQVLDLTHPEAFAYIESRLHALVADLEPRYLKWDHNRDLAEAGSSTTGYPVAHEQTLAFYRLVDGLKEAFPGLEIESCAGGGGRIDLGVLDRVDRVWASDCNDPLERQRIQLHTSLLVPPEMMGAHIGPPRAHTTHRTASLDFRAGTAMWGHLGVEWDLSGAEATEPHTRALIADWIALHKRFRALLHSGSVVRSDIGDPSRLLHGVVAQDRSEALYAFVSIDTAHMSPLGSLLLEGLDPDRDYRVAPVGPVALAHGGPRGAPPWWHLAQSSPDAAPVMTGRALGAVGVQAPGLDPEEVVLIHVTALSH